jgi:hypothetical protein
MRTKFVEILDQRKTIHAVNPCHVTSVALTGGVVGEGKQPEAVVEIRMADGQVISAVGFGPASDAVENCLGALGLEVA